MNVFVVERLYVCVYVWIQSVTLRTLSFLLIEMYSEYHRNNKEHFSCKFVNSVSGEIRS